MRRHRTTARGVLFLAAMLGLAFATVAFAANKVPDHIIFPVVGQARYIDDFGAPRPGGPHQGNDLMAAKKSPAVAAEAGKVKYWTTSRTAGCMLYLYGESGTTYYYIHLNNDLTMRNDNSGKCVKGVAYTVFQGTKPEPMDLEVLGVEPEELVAQSDIAQRRGRSRESISLLVKGERGPRNFPKPRYEVGDRGFWRWADVERWFDAYEGRAPQMRHDAFIEAVNAVLAVRHSQLGLESGERDELRRLARGLNLSVASERAGRS